MEDDDRSGASRKFDDSELEVKRTRDNFLYRFLSLIMVPSLFLLASLAIIIVSNFTINEIIVNSLFNLI